jgi:Predicted membrane protein
VTGNGLGGGGGRRGGEGGGGGGGGGSVRVREMGRKFFSPPLGGLGGSRKGEQES